MKRNSVSLVRRHHSAEDDLERLRTEIMSHARAFVATTFALGHVRARVQSRWCHASAHARCWEGSSFDQEPTPLSAAVLYNGDPQGGKSRVTSIAEEIMQGQGGAGGCCGAGVVRHWNSGPLAPRRSGWSRARQRTEHRAPELISPRAGRGRWQRTGRAGCGSEWERIMARWMSFSMGLAF